MKNIIDDKQFKIIWNVDDLNTSRVHPAIFSRVFADIYMEYGKIVKMTITREKINKYLGKTIDHS